VSVSGFNVYFMANSCYLSINKVCGVYQMIEFNG